MGICANEKKGSRTDQKANGNDDHLDEKELKSAIDKLYQEYDKDGSGTLDKH